MLLTRVGYLLVRRLLKVNMDKRSEQEENRKKRTQVSPKEIMLLFRKAMNLSEVLSFSSDSLNELVRVLK